MKMILKWTYAKIDIFILLCAVTLIFVCLGNEKIVWFCDEMYTYTIANHGSFGMNLQEQSWCSGKTILDTFFVANEGIQFRKVIECTAADNHPPVYYLLFHVVSVLVGVYSKWIGLIFNWPFYCAIIIALFYVGIKNAPDLKSRIVVYIAVLAFATNGGVLSLALLIRMYMLMVFFLLGWLYFYYQLLLGNTKAKIYVGILLCTVAGTLTNYVFLIYIACLSFAYGMISLIRHNWKGLSHFIACMVASGLCTVLIFPPIFKQIFQDNKGLSAFEKGSKFSQLGKNMMDALSVQNHLLFYRFYHIGMLAFIVITIIYFLLFHAKEEERTTNLFIAVNVICQYLYCILARHMFLAENRYLYPSMVAEYFLMFWMLMKISSYGKQFMRGSFIVLLTCLLVNVCVNVRAPQVEYYGTVEMKEQWDELVSCRKTPWIFYGEFDWIAMYNALDFTIPEQINNIRKNSVPRQDEILDRNQEYLVFLNPNEEDIDTFLNYLEDAVKSPCVATKWMQRHYLVVYRVKKCETEKSSRKN